MTMKCSSRLARATPWRARLAAWTALLPLLAAVGCAGPLTVTAVVAGEAQSAVYHLDPSGRLEVTTGGGRFEGGSSQSLHKAHLDAAAMDKLRQTIMASGFFLETGGGSSMYGGGPVVHLEIELGMWNNKLDSRGGSSSIARVLEELNRHVPERLRIPYTSQSSAAEEEEFRRQFDEH